ncbi:MAG TPA: thioesterase domain-containing protein [Ruminiclostridium sp.]|nr:thioesterase domain-containing protein [Ruminiclostridium sp.]
MGEVKLFCLPYAGGSAGIYLKWRKYLADSVKLYPVELAGRAGRIKEPYYDSMSDAVEDIANQVENEIQNSEYAIFGHSMGSILTYELICRIQEKGLKLPKHAFFSGKHPPCVEQKGRNMHLLSDDELLRKAVSLGGIPEKLVIYRGLMEIAIKILRADYRVLETYGCNPVIQKLDFDISVLSGIDDQLSTAEDMEKWKQYADRKCTFYRLEGAHFYLNDNVEEVVNIINNTLVN